MAHPFDEPFNFNFNVQSHTSTLNFDGALPELLKHPSVMSLWHQNLALQVSQNKLMDTISSMQQINVALQYNLRSLTTELSAAKQKVGTITAEIQSLQVDADFGPQFCSSPATSVHPSDSISQCHRPGSPSHDSHVSILPAQPATRPSEYPPEVLWLLDDCRHDEYIDIKEFNKPRPSMERAIRHPNGNLIRESEWAAIKSSARRIANELSSLPVRGSARRTKTRKTKVYYRTNHAKEWTDAITRLVDEQPLLALCASNWKADHVLGNSISAIASRDATSKRKHSNKKQKCKEKGKAKTKGDDSDDNYDDEDDDDDNDNDRNRNRNREDDGDETSGHKGASDSCLHEHTCIMSTSRASGLNHHRHQVHTSKIQQRNLEESRILDKT